MILRARPARWFEALIPRPSVARAVELLADSGCVQLEKERGRLNALPDLAALRTPLEAYRSIRQRYRGYWPSPEFPVRSEDERLEDRLQAALAVLKRWEQAAAPDVERIEGLRRERHDLQRLAEFLNLVIERDDLDLETVATARAPLAGVLLALSEHAAVPAMAEGIIVVQAGVTPVSYLLALGPEEDIRELTQAVGGREAQILPLPEWLAGSPAQALSKLSARVAAIDGQLESAYSSLAQVCAEHRLSLCLGELRRLEWFARHLEGIPLSDHLARVTGWTCADPERLAQPLRAAGIAAVLQFGPAPRGMYPPTLDRNPAWAQPFEWLARLAGTPGGNEADPTPLVAVVAPLLFGYMFGDVGQGAVLLAAGIGLRRRWPALGMLIPGGVMAMLFGLMFGSIFCSEGLVAPLWVEPLREPLIVLLMPLALGAVLILGSMVLQGVEEHWAGRGRDWLQTDAGLIVLYCGMLLLPWQGATGGALVATGALWFVLGSALPSQLPRHASMASRTGELMERLLQLGVNTVSFVRVGAFAIAHAGLAAAVTSLALAAGEGANWLVLVVGNILILALEGLVVSVQTTRLILFEFFVRFVHAGGRPFEALVSPSASRFP